MAEFDWPLLERAQSARESGNLEDALDLYEQALAEAPLAAEIRRKIGVIQLKLERWQDAADTLSAAVREKPSLNTAYVSLAKALHQLGRHAEAAEAYAMAIAAGPAEASMLVGYADCLRSLDRFAQARSLYLQALALEPRNVEARARMIDHALRDNDVDLLFQHLKQLPADRPSFIQLLVDGADLLCKRRRFADAEGAYQRAVDVVPADRGALAGLAECAAGRERWALAATRFQAAAAVDPDNVAVQVGLATSLFETGKAAEAEPIARRVVAADPEERSAAALLARIYNRRGEPEAALEVLTAPARKWSDHRVTQFAYGNALRGAGRFDEAEALYKGMQEQTPEDLELVYRLSELAVGRGDGKGAYMLSGPLVNRAPGELRYQLHHATVLRLCGRAAEAEECYEQIIWHWPKTVGAYNGLAYLARAGGDRERAERLFAKVAELSPTETARDSEVAAA